MPTPNASFNGIPIHDSPPPSKLGMPYAIIQDNFPSFFLTTVYFNDKYASGDVFTVAIFRVHPKNITR